MANAIVGPRRQSLAPMDEHADWADVVVDGGRARLHHVVGAG
jgi:hypothetical protein